MSTRPKIVCVCGLEHFNRRIWDDVSAKLAREAEILALTEYDLKAESGTAQALREADVVFLTMLNFHNEAVFLREHVSASKAKAVFVFESMPELMQLTRVGSYSLAGKSGMPEPMKKIARLLVGGREEDTLYGFIKLMGFMRVFTRVMPKSQHDFKTWMQVNMYWNQPSEKNLTSMFRLILRDLFAGKIEPDPVVEIPNMGVYHPDAPGLFKDVASYTHWRKKTAKRNAPAPKGRVGIVFFRKHLLQEPSYIDDSIRALEAEGLEPIPVFVLGIEGHVVVREWLAKERIDLLINMIGFALVGGPAGSTKPGHAVEVAIEMLSHIDAPYIVAQPLYTQDEADWKEHGVAPMQSAVLFALPEMDGATVPTVIGAVDEGRFKTVPDRLQRLTGLGRRWIELRQKRNAEKKVAIVVYDFPPGAGKLATAALLDVPSSVFAMLQRLKAEGYDVGELPESPRALLERLEASLDPNGGGISVSRDSYRAITSDSERIRLEERWGNFPGEVAPVGREAVFVGGVHFGKVYLGVQPRFVLGGDPMRLLFDKANTPHHQYLAFYRYISRVFKADAMIHVGMHGSVEWMPGLQLGIRSECWPDALLGEVPHLYLYAANNPSESNLAKRRGYATMISHAVPPLSRAGVYAELARLKDLLTEYRERANPNDPVAIASLVGAEELILHKVETTNLSSDCPRLAGEPFPRYVSRLYACLRDIEERLITGSLHVLGTAQPTETQLTIVVETLKGREPASSLTGLMSKLVAGGADYAQLGRRARAGEADAFEARQRIDEACVAFVRACVFERKPLAAGLPSQAGGAAPAPEIERWAEALVRDGRALVAALGDNRGEIEAVVRGLSGHYITPGPGGDIIRDGMRALPTGRNIHAMDPWRVPSEFAFKRGGQIAESIIERHREQNGGAYPETIAQVIWGLDAIKTKGESIGTVLRMIGAEPAHDGQGKVSHYELIPLDVLGRPRIDVIMNLSPVFRDTFGIVMDLLDDLVRRAAAADEPHEMNYIRKHVDEAVAAGETFARATARLFTQKPGDYGTYVDDMVDDSSWKTQDDLADMFLRRNAFAYGGDRNGAATGEVLRGLLGTVSRVSQEIDSVEFGVTDIDHYFGSSGGLMLAARRAVGEKRSISLDYVESFTAETQVRDVSEVLRMEYRTKLLNPRWYEGMLEHGHSGAAEISNRFTYMLGWSAVGGGVDNWVYSEAAKTFVLDPAMRERLAKLNPQAVRNMTARLLEANGRGLWQTDEETLEQLRSMYADIEDRLEGVFG
jgi:magnesium chelatase subunit H